MVLIDSIDTKPQQLNPFFHPRLQQLTDHFRLEGGTIVPLISAGRVTAKIFQFNLLERILERDSPRGTLCERLIQIGLYPANPQSENS